MDYFKGVTFSICTTVLCFGIVKNIMPSNFYVKYIRLVFTMLFIVLLANATAKIATGNNLDFILPEIEYKSETTQEMLSRQIQTFLNNELKKNKYPTVCKKVNVIFDSGNYYILNIEITKNSKKSDIIKFLAKITGLQEEQIYVEP